MDQSKVGTDWNADELDAIVADYFAMLALDTAGRPFVKAHRALMQRTGRSHRSVEFKHMNISAVAAELGLPPRSRKAGRGYRPMANYQSAIFDAIDRHLATHPAVLADDTFLLLPLHGGGGPRRGGGGQPHTPSFQGVSEPASQFVGDGGIQPLTLTEAPPPGPPRSPSPEGLARLVRKYDPAARDHRNRALGKLGEEPVFHHERARLIAHDRPDLARRIEWTSQERGDGISSPSQMGRGTTRSVVEGSDREAIGRLRHPQFRPHRHRAPNRGQGHPRRPHHTLLADPHRARGLPRTPRRLAPLPPPRPIGRAGTVRLAATAGGVSQVGGGDVAGGVLEGQLSAVIRYWQPTGNPTFGRTTKF